MSVKIEILDYKYGEFEGTQMISNYSFTSASDWDLGTGWAISNGSANHSIGSYGYLKHFNLNFIQGQTYRIKYKISGRTTGDFVLANHLAGNANGFSQNTNGAFVYDWVQGSNNNNVLSLFGSSSFDGSIEYVSVYHITGIDWDNSIVGELDVTDHSDFPLAMTFQISDFKDLTSTTGDYSKSFKIPATKNNNNILKHLYTPNLIVDNKLTDKKSCRIIFDNIYPLVGLIQIDGVGGYGETPSYYNCVFFGSNLNWADKIQDTYMNAIEWGDDGENLAYNKDSIVATWQHEDCNNASNSPIVYPITSYGDYNPLGTVKTIQLLDTLYGNSAWGSDQLGYYGFYDDGVSYGTPPPVADWRPSVFVKTTLDKIFKAVGYNVNSAFMNTDMFKRLVWLLPNFKYNNPEQREIDYSVESKFENGVSMTTGAITVNPATNPIITEDGVQMFYPGAAGGFVGLSAAAEDVYLTGAGTQVLDIQSLNLTVTLNSSYVDMANNYVTIEEYGTYKITLSGLESKLARGFKGGNDFETIDAMQTRVLVEVQTVGQSSWNIINSKTNSLYPLNANGNLGVNEDLPSSTEYVDIPTLSFTSYFNKGDKIRLKLGTRMWSGDHNQTFFIWLFFRSKSTSNFNIELNPIYVEYGQTYNLQDVMNPNYKQIDFIKGISHAFNLKMTTDESTNTVNIEPFDDFYKPYADAVDWTYKLDRSSEINDKWLESDLKRTLVFKYKSDDSDIKVKARGIYFFNDIQDEFPYIEELPSTFKKGDSTFENPFFAGTFNCKNQDTAGGVANLDTAFSACLWTENSNPSYSARPTQGYDFLPRLLYWNKYSPATAINLNKSAAVQTWSSVGKGVVASGNITPTGSFLSNIYPQATMINADSTTSPILSYGNVWVRDYDDATGVYTAIQTGKGLYDTYYRNMFESIKRSPRLRTVSISLSISDIIDLDFTKLVYIDGVYWRINKVIDYKPNNNESTKVELIEWFQIGVFAATAPMFGGGSNDWNVDGSVTTDNNDIGL